MGKVMNINLIYQEFMFLNFDGILACRRYKNQLYRIFHSLLYCISLDEQRLREEHIILFDSTLLKNRPDYKQYLDNFEYRAKNSGLKIQRIKLTYKLSPLKLVSKLITTILIFIKWRVWGDSFQLSQFFELYKKINNLEFEGKSLIVFCDAHPEDNLLVQMAKNRGVAKTFTFQHGFYIDFFKSINSEVYKNFISDYMLTWGDVSKEIISGLGVEDKRLISFGCFKSVVDRKKVKSSRSTILILLNGVHNAQTNEKLINIANSLALDGRVSVMLKKHPDDHSSYMLNDNVVTVTSLQYAINNSDLALITESGVFVDLFLAKMPFYFVNTGLMSKEYLLFNNIIDYNDSFCVSDVIDIDIDIDIDMKGLIKDKVNFEVLM